MPRLEVRKFCVQIIGGAAAFTGNYDDLAGLVDFDPGDLHPGGDDGLRRAGDVGLLETERATGHFSYHQKCERATLWRAALGLAGRMVWLAGL